MPASREIRLCSASRCSPSRDGRQPYRGGPGSKVVSCAIQQPALGQAAFDNCCGSARKFCRCSCSIRRFSRSWPRSRSHPIVQPRGGGAVDDSQLARAVLLVVDDASTDDLQGVVASFVDPRVLLAMQCSRGPSANCAALQSMLSCAARCLLRADLPLAQMKSALRSQSARTW